MQYWTLIYAAVGVLAAQVLFHTYKTLTSPLLSVPGPIWARFSRLWYFFRIRNGQFEHENIALHRKYGPIVRLAPNMYSIADPSVVKPVYGIGSKFAKSEWYEGWKHPSPDRWTVFADRDAKRHAEVRKRFQNLYSMSTMVSYEGYVDECTKIFGEKINELAARREQVDLSLWFQLYAFDVIGCITYGQPFGFLKAGKDVAGTFQALHSAMIYSTLVGMYAKLHPFLYAIMEKIPGTGAAGRAYIMNFIQSKIGQRNRERAANKGKNDPEKLSGAPQDFLDKLMDAHDADPQKVTQYHMFMMGMSNVFAGSDTTAISLSSILYYLLKNPNTLRRLRKEVDEYTADGRCSYPNVTFKESQNMPYLQAVMKEALRVHSATGLPLWRDVPEGGAEICGQFFPAGTTVGINIWCAHYNEEVFGHDAKEFRPERWLESEGQNAEKLKAMESYYMPFGLGSRTCIGRHISTLEMSKLIPQLVRTLDFELVRPNEDWQTENYWFVKPLSFDVRVSARSSSA